MLTHLISNEFGQAYKIAIKREKLRDNEKLNE
jgi:hypothetical protein